MDVNKAVVREYDLVEIEDKRQLVSPEVTMAFHGFLFVFEF
jgi:hypothetical protein